MASSSFCALFDANVLYPFILRDTIVRLCETRVFRGRWTDRIQEEWIRSLLSNRPDLDEDRVRAMAGMMNEAVEDALIRNDEQISLEIELPDEDDRHVIEAAVVGRVDVIVTFNTADFPSSQLWPLGIQAQHPDVFLDHLLDLHPNMAHVFSEQRAAYTRNPMTKEVFLEHFERLGLIMTAERLRSRHLDWI